MGRVVVLMGEFGCVSEENLIFGKEDFCYIYDFAQKEEDNLMVKVGSSQFIFKGH